MALKNIVRNINVKNIKYPGTNLTYEQVLKKELHRFADILQQKIDEYFESYQPRVYDRGNHGGDLRHALTVDDVCELSATGKSITCRILINDNAIHNSILDGSEANAFWLLNEGWEVQKNVWFKDIYRFGYYEGAHFVENAVDEFERTNKYGIKIEVVRPLLYY
jgi:hypothetical protein